MLTFELNNLSIHTYFLQNWNTFQMFLNEFKKGLEACHCFLSKI
jgi:hypothetical protein